ncbi:MAG: hypothetical protein EXS25_00710 [Pedosphaera sp.]|nr:hypothetical protein [Pedosphaera sp.]
MIQLIELYRGQSLGFAKSRPRLREILGLIFLGLPLMLCGSEKEVAPVLTSPLSPSEAPTVSRVSVTLESTKRDEVIGSRRFEGGILYVQVGRVTSALKGRLGELFREAKWTNGSTGLVLDLRFCDGDGFEAVGAVTSLFSERSGEVFQWESKAVFTDGVSHLWTKPLAVLINGKTQGAASILAAVLREETGAILLGQATASFPSGLKEAVSEERVQSNISSGSVRLSNGSEISTKGVQADIEVRVKEEEERVLMIDLLEMTSAQTVKTLKTNKARIRLNEAELVRAHREGSTPRELARGPQKESAPEGRDLVLGRGVDVLRGLAFLRVP